jgi:hypothetical protein
MVFHLLVNLPGCGESGQQIETEEDEGEGSRHEEPRKYVER